VSVNAIKEFWPELPTARIDIDYVEMMLADWVAWSEPGNEPSKKHDLREIFINSVIHPIECALVFQLATLKNKDFDNATLKNINELEYVFPLCNPGYSLELAHALSTCYSLENPWDLSPEFAHKYARELVAQLKDIALYEIDPSKFWEVKAKKFTTGRKKGAISDLKKYVRDFIIDNKSKGSAKENWKKLMAKVTAEGDDSPCPLYADEDRLYEYGFDKEYGFPRFEKHFSEFKPR
jgi:hypothetical protein